VTTAAVNGAASINAAGLASYTSNAGFAGNDSFIVTVTDNGTPQRSGAVTINVVVTDVTAPMITLNGATPVSIVRGSVYNDAGATAADNVDGNITANIATVNPVNTAIVGAYTVTYDVSDAAGNAATQVTRTVNVGGSTAQVLLSTGGTVDIVSANEILSNFSAASTTGTTPPAGVSFPFGIVSYTTTVTGGSQTVKLTFSTALPANLELYKVNNAGVYTLIPNGAGADQWTQVNATTVALTFTDGGAFDLDGNAANGVIIDPVAVGGTGVTLPLVTGSGGCAIAANPNTPVDPSLPVLVLLSAVWLAIKRKRGGSVSGDHR